MGGSILVRGTFFLIELLNLVWGLLISLSEKKKKQPKKEIAIQINI